MKKRQTGRRHTRLAAFALLLALIWLPSGCGDKPDAAQGNPGVRTSDTSVQAMRKGVISKDSANVRSSPGLTEDNKLGILKKYTPVIVIGETDGWYKIEYDGAAAGFGYVSIGYIDITGEIGTDGAGGSADGSVQANGENAVTAINREGTVTKKGVAVRSAPEISDETRLGSLKKDTVVKVLEQTGEWYKIEYKTAAGYAYVAAQYIKLKEKADQPVEAEGFTALATAQKGVVNDTGVYIRKAPDTSKDTRLRMAEKGASVTVVAQSDEWYQISWKTSSGVAYIAKKYVTISAGTATVKQNFTKLPKKLTGTVNDTGVYVRRSPDTANSARITQLKKGAKVTVVAYSADWYKIEYSKTASGYAYVAAPYLYVPIENGNFSTLSQKTKGTINDTGVYVRKSPDTTKESKIKMLEKGASVTVVAQSGEWYKIEYKTSSGYAYVSARYVTLSSSAVTSENGFTPLSKKTKGTVNDNGVFIRKAPDTTKESKIKMLKKGTALAVVAYNSQWYKVEYTTTSGYAYIAAQYLTLPDTALPSAVTAQDFTETGQKLKGVITKGGVFVRSKPDTTEKSKITTLKKGATVTVIGQSGDWYKIEYKNTKTKQDYAYIAAKYVSVSTADDQTGFTELPDKPQAEITKNGVFVRSRPDTSEASKLGTLKRHTVVTVLAKSDKWYKIQYTTTQGYAFVAAQFVSFDEVSSNTANRNSANAYIVTKDGVFVRNKPDTTGDTVLTTLKKGDVVEVISKEDNWYKIKFSSNGGVAYVAAQFLSKSLTEDDPAAATVTDKKANAEYWLNYTKSYARKAGFTLVSGQDGSFDSPIPVESGSGSSDVRQMITDRLNGYKQYGVKKISLWLTQEYSGNWELVIAYR